MLNALTALPERLDNRPQAEGTAQFIFEKQAAHLLAPWIRRVLQAAHLILHFLSITQFKFGAVKRRPSLQSIIGVVYIMSSWLIPPHTIGSEIATILYMLSAPPYGATSTPHS